jgi:hypothetical protein
VIKLLDKGVFEVEFRNNKGHTYASLALHAEQLLPLYYSSAAA